MAADKKSRRLTFICIAHGHQGMSERSDEIPDGKIPPQKITTFMEKKKAKLNVQLALVTDRSRTTFLRVCYLLLLYALMATS